MTIEGSLGRLRVGDPYPVRMMAVINLSEESFYRGSVARPEDLLSRACSLVDEGASIIDLGAVSNAPGSPAIPEEVERDRLMPALRMLQDEIDIDISVDTQRSSIAEMALLAGATCINDVSCLRDRQMARTVADHDSSLVLMASRDRPGDLLLMDEIIERLAWGIREATAAGVDPLKISVDPGVGHWIPEKAPAHDLAILDGMPRLRALGRPVMAAVSRKSFIGAVLGQPDPGERLPGSLASTAIAIYNGAHIVRTHDVGATMAYVRMAEAIRSRAPFPGRSSDDAPGRTDGIRVEVLACCGHPGDMQEAFRGMGVGEGGDRILCKKASFRVLMVEGISPMEALIIKQEMLSRGGDAAIPKAALRCDPSADRAMIFGTSAQISGLVRKLKDQTFNLPQVAEQIEEALRIHEGPGRHRL